jgi:hypothetical protein
MSTKRTIISGVISLDIEKTTTYDIGNPSPDFAQT